MGKEKKIRILSLARWSIQVSFLLLFILFFLQTRYGVGASFPNLLFRFDPLILVVTSVATRSLTLTVMPALFVMLLTLVFGRFFCGFICPLGTSIDIFDATLGRRWRRRFSVKNCKYLIFLFLLVSALLGVSLLRFLDPLVIFERSLTFVFYPATTHLASLFSDSRATAYEETAAAFLTFAAVLGLGLLSQRFWCRALCPLGALLATLSRFSLFRFFFRAECSRCRACDAICPTGAIRSELGKIDSAECIDCLRCKHECPHQAIHFGRKRSTIPSDLKRRHFLAAVGSAIVTASVARVLGGHKYDRRLLRPPGSIPENDFVNTCVSCGKCMKVCPTRGLQPCILEAGLQGIWTPRLVPRIGGCEKECNMCGQVCPTSAIRRLPLQEKIHAKIGTAVVTRDDCIAWSENKVCLICDEVCPHDAVNAVSRTIDGVSLLRPVVDEKACMGCGLCESRCPTEGPAAIQVFSDGEERRRIGSYVNEERHHPRHRRGRQDDIPSGFILDDN